MSQFCFCSLHELNPKILNALCVHKRLMSLKYRRAFYRKETQIQRMCSLFKSLHRVFVQLVSSACSNLWLIGRKTKGSCVYVTLYIMTNWFFAPDTTFPVPQPHLQLHRNTPSSFSFVCLCVCCTLDMRPSSCL